MPIVDTIRLAAFHRARETARPDAVFRDRYARLLAGAPDAAIQKALSAGDRADWFYTARTHVFDRLISREVAQGADMVVQIGAGLDARPYRLELPPTLRWIEIDSPDVLDYKAEVLSRATPACGVERIAVDLSNHDARRGVFAGLGRRAARAIVVAEGLLIHLMAGEVGALSIDLAAPAGFRRWLADIPSAALIDILNETSGEVARRAGAPYVFAPAEGPAFFREDGWHVLGVRSLLRAAARLERLPMTLRLKAMLPDRSAFGGRPSADVCLLGKDPGSND